MTAPSRPLAMKELRHSGASLWPSRNEAPELYRRLQDTFEGLASPVRVQLQASYGGRGMVTVERGRADVIFELVEVDSLHLAMQYYVPDRLELAVPLADLMDEWLSHQGLISPLDGKPLGARLRFQERMVTFDEFVDDLRAGEAELFRENDRCSEAFHRFVVWLVEGDGGAILSAVADGLTAGRAMDGLLPEDEEEEEGEG